MSLFPAYSAIKDQDECQSLTWLKNESCPPEVSVTYEPSLPQINSDSECNKTTPSENLSKSKKKKSKKSKSKKKKKKKYASSNNSNYSSSDESESDTLSKQSKFRLSPVESQSKASLDYSSSDSSTVLSSSSLRRKKCKKRARSKSSVDRSRSIRSSEKKLRCDRLELQSSSFKNARTEPEKSSHKHKKSSKEKSRQSYNIYSEQSKSKIPVLNGKNVNIFLQGLLRVLQPEDVLFIDQCGDRNNTIFPTTHYSQVAKYYKLTSQPLGSSNNYRVKRKLKKATRYFSKSCCILPDSVPLNQSLKNVYSECTKEYIPMKFTYKEESEIKKTLRDKYDVNYLKILDPATEAYLLGKSKSINSDENTPEGENPEQVYWKNKVKSYNERLAQDPHNISLWLKFLNFQDKALVHIFNGDEQNGNKKNKRGKNTKELVERKLSILDTAIKKNIRVIKLKFERLELGQDIWENKILILEWNKLVSNFPNDMQVWYRYLIFYQTHFPTFHLQNVVQAYGKCSERLIQMQNGTFLSHKPPENISYHLINLTTQLAYVWYQGGYMERSIALFQALIEFNLFCPHQLTSHDVDFDSKLAIFEAFWDSKAPRFGEKESVGWANFMEKREPVVFPEEILEGTHDEEDVILSKGGSKPKLWIELESSRELHHWLPWQRDPDDCEDLERMVSFSDIKRHIYTIQPEDVFYLILQFLNFLGVTIPQCIIDSHSLSEGCNAIFYSLRLESLKNLLMNNYTNMDIKDQEDTFNFPVIGPSVHKIEPEAYFEFVCQVLDQSMNFIIPKLKPKLIIILIRLFTERSSVLKQGDPQLFLSNVKIYKSKIKNILKQAEFRCNLEIYLEYAGFQRNLGLYEECSKIHIMALSSALQGNRDMLSISEDGEEREVVLRHLLSIIHLELMLEEKELTKCHVYAVVNMICSFVLDNAFLFSQPIPTGAQILKTKRKLNNIIETKLKTMEEGDEVNEYLLSYSVNLLVILQLLTAGFQPACLIMEQFIENIEKLSTCKTKSLEKIDDLSDQKGIIVKPLKHIKELIYENYFWLIETAPKLNHVFACLPMSPSSVRTIIKNAIEVSPENVTFLEKLVEYQSWRDILGGIGLHAENDSSILIVLYRLLPHIKNVMKLLSNAETGVLSSGNQLESILQSAVSTSCGRNCPLLWRLYLRLTQATRPRLLKTLAYRALDSCPSAKCLYMDCVRLIPDSLSEILKLMNEKGLRVRLPLEELEVLLENEEEEETHGGELEEEMHKDSEEEVEKTHTENEEEVDEGTHTEIEDQVEEETYTENEKELEKQAYVENREVEKDALKENREEETSTENEVEEKIC